MDQGDSNPDKVRAARASLSSNAVLVLLKLSVGFWIGSVSVLSEAFHSLTDLVASGIALYTVRLADRPADEDHPYGHGKFESLSAMLEALLIMGAAIYIVYESVHRLLAGLVPEQVDWGLGVMGLSVVVNWWVSSWLAKVARRTDSLALEADAQHLRTDVYTSLAVFGGLVLVALTGWPSVDPAVALAVALLMLVTALRLMKSAADPLLDTQLPASEIQAVRDVFEGDDRVLGYHKLRTRKSGSRRHVDAHVQLEDSLSLLKAHDLTEQLEDRIRDALPNCEITLHTEPFRAEMLHQHEEHGGPPPPRGEHGSDVESDPGKGG